MNDCVCNLELMEAIAEANSLEGWTKVTDDALHEWHNDTKGIKFMLQLITRIISACE